MTDHSNQTEEDSLPSSHSKSSTKSIQPTHSIHQTEPNQKEEEEKQKEQTQENRNPNSKRLTRSTYIGDEDQSTSNRKRSSSTDSENGWIPPPPLLPLQTEFLITNSKSTHYQQLQLQLQSIHQTTKTNHQQLRVAHLKCPDSSRSSESNLSSFETPCFKLIQESDLIKGSKRIKLESNLNSNSSSNVKNLENHQIQSNLNLIKKHKTYEMLEKRSKRLEKEKLIHERFKLKSDLNLLKNPHGIDWKFVKSIILKRIKEEERRKLNLHQFNHSNQDSNRPLNQEHSNQNHSNPTNLLIDGERENEKVERMRWIMVKEAQETLERYDKLLDTRKPSMKARQVLPPPPTTTTSIPTLNSTLRSNSPQSSSLPPIGLPNKRPLPASDRTIIKRSKSKRPVSEESLPEALHLSLKLKTPITIKESKPSSSKTKIRVRSQGTMTSKSRQVEESLEGEEEEEEEEEEEREEEEEEEEEDEEEEEEEEEGLDLSENQEDRLTRKRIKRYTSEGSPEREVESPVRIIRESLYESDNLRRMILEEGLMIGGERRRKLGRKLYGFGIRLPDFNSIKFESYLIRFESILLQQGLKFSPFLKFDEVLPNRIPLNFKSNHHHQQHHHDEPLEGNLNDRLNEGSLEEDQVRKKDWIEFDPRLEEMKALIEKREEFGMNSVYFDLIDELEELEDRMKERGEGKSLRRLMWERVVLSED